jgi:hypothetical protein
MSCERCPCPNGCLGWEVFCLWASEVPEDPIKIRHIVNRSTGAIGGRAPSSDLFAELEAARIAAESLPAGQGQSGCNC